jgi:RNA polymerase sporulation-specific sigma factor
MFRFFRRRIYRLTRGYFAPGADRDDFLKEATIGFFKAVRDFVPEKGDFAGFMSLCVRRQLATFVKQATRLKYGPLNQSISIDARLYNDSEKSLLEYLSATDLGMEATQAGSSAVMEALSSACSPLERNILLLYTAGHNYSDIVGRLQVTPKAVNNALWRVKNKARRLGVST